MKICIVTHRVVKGDGQGRVNYEVTLEALQRGHCVTLIASSICSELQQHPRVNWVPVSTKGFPLALFRNAVFSWVSTRELRKSHENYDVVKVNGAITNFPGDINSVHFVHSSWLRSAAHTFKHRRDMYGVYQWIYTYLNSRWEKRALKQARIKVAVSEKVRNELVDLGISPESIRVILNGVDLQEFHPGKIERENLSLPGNVPLALFVGDIQTPRKNLDTVLKVLAQIPSLHLAVVGTLANSPYPSMAEKLGIETRTHFLGYRQDVTDLMKAVDLFLFPSRYEACTLVLLEALACGLPVITAATAGGAEVVTPECGFVLEDSEDVKNLVEVTQKVIRDSALRKKMGQSARTVAEQHSWGRMAKSYVDLFEELSQR